MARSSNDPRLKVILDAVAHWKTNCLLRDGSVFSDDQIWSAENLGQLDKYFVQAPILGPQRFIEKFRQQLEPASGPAKKLGAEAIWLMWLFPSNVGPEMKVSRVVDVWSWSGDTLKASHPLLAAPVESGVGSAGPGFNTRFPEDLTFLINAMRAWKALQDSEQRTLLTDGWRFGNWLDPLTEGQNPQLRHMLLYLLFPDLYAQVSSLGAKRKISNALKDTPGVDHALKQVNIANSDSPLVQLDKRLLAIRTALEITHPGADVNFYEEPFKSL